MNKEVFTTVCHVCDLMRRASSIIAEELAKFTPQNSRLIGALAMIQNAEYFYIQLLNGEARELVTDGQKFAVNRARHYYSMHTHNKYINDLSLRVLGVPAPCFISYLENRKFYA